MHSLRNILAKTLLADWKAGTDTVGKSSTRFQEEADTICVQGILAFFGSLVRKSLGHLR